MAMRPGGTAMKTRIVLTFDEIEFARLAGAASARHLTVRDYVRIVALDATYPPPKRIVLDRDDGGHGEPEKRR